MTASRSQISNSSSSSSETTSTATPASRRSISACRICALAPTSTPQVGCAAISTFGRCRISRPTMNFCRLPPERLRAAASGPAALTLDDAIDRRPRSDRAASARMSRARRGRGRCAVSSALSASDISGTAPRPRRSSGTNARPSAGAAPRPGARRPCRRARSRRVARRGARRRAPPAAPSGRCPRRRRCRRSRRRARSSVMSASVVPNGSSGGSVEAVDDRARRAPAARGAMPRMRQARRRSSSARALASSRGADRIRRSPCRRAAPSRDGTARGSRRACG